MLKIRENTASLNINFSPRYSLYISCGTDKENFSNNQEHLQLVIIFFILMTSMFVLGVILNGENGQQSLLRVKGFGTLIFERLLVVQLICQFVSINQSFSLSLIKSQLIKHSVSLSDYPSVKFVYKNKTKNNFVCHPTCQYLLESHLLISEYLPFTEFFWSVGQLFCQSVISTAIQLFWSVSGNHFSMGHSDSESIVSHSHSQPP